MSRIYPEISLHPGETYDGFVIREVTPLANIRAVAYQVEHSATGARLLHLHADDSENLFAIAFRTPPADDTGLPHILEHSVLDGSQKYAAKKPFFEMVKMSMATFINAMTYRDKTVYPIASNVKQDFYNLAEVYCDAVFHPKLAEYTLKQEGRRLDFKTKGDPASDLIVKGIVYNEMKGALSGPDSVVYNRSSLLLFPDTPYGKNSGGDPEAIPDLTYENFLRFHQELYHPSNAYIFLYGDIPTRDHLEFLKDKLKGFQQQPIHAPLPRQPRWTEPRSQTEYYPIAREDETENRTYFTINWLVGDGTDPYDVLSFTLLDLVLLGNQGAPVRKAIIDSKLGQDLVYSGFSGGGLESTFRVGLKGSEPDRQEAFLELVLSTLSRIAGEGIPREKVETAFQQLAYRYLEIQSMYPLWLMDRAYSSWIYDANPLLGLRGDEIMEEIRQRYEADPGMFSRLIRERLLENPHRLMLAFLPDKEFLAKKEAQFAERMAARKAALSHEELEQIAQDAEELDRIQSTPNTPEELAALPQLRVSDVPSMPRLIPTTVEKVEGGIDLLHNDVFAHGVNYFQLDINLEGLPEHLYPYLPLYGDCVRKMGAAGMDYVKMAERTAAHTGGVQFGTTSTTHAANPDRCLRRARFSLKALDSQLEEALLVLRDYLFKLDPTDGERLGDVLIQARAGWRSALVSNGLGLALRHAARGFNPESAIAETMQGLPQVRLIKDLADRYEAEPGEVLEQVIPNLVAIRDFMLDRGRLTASFTGSETAHRQVHQALGNWASGMRDEPVQDIPISYQPYTTLLREGLAAPMEVAFCAQAFPAPHVSHPDEPLLAIAGHLLSLDYMLEQVRVKGGAYGGGCGHDASHRNWHFYSYRDPWINKTLDVFQGLPEYLNGVEWSQAEVDRSIIGTAKNAERPIRPGEATSMALSWYIMGYTPEVREKRHKALLGATAHEVKRAVQDLLERNMKQSSVCIVSSREKLEMANQETPGTPLEIEEIMK